MIKPGWATSTKSAIKDIGIIISLTGLGLAIWGSASASAASVQETKDHLARHDQQLANQDDQLKAIRTDIKLIPAMKQNIDDIRDYFQVPKRVGGK